MASLEVDKKAVRRDVQIREHPIWLRERATVENLIVAMRAIDSPGALRECTPRYSKVSVAASDSSPTTVGGSRTCAETHEVRPIRSAVGGVRR